jgi:hypothetical protein
MVIEFDVGYFSFAIENITVEAAGIEVVCAVVFFIKIASKRGIVERKTCGCANSGKHYVK